MIWAEIPPNVKRPEEFFALGALFSHKAHIVKK
jgi:hypothetical protein